MIIIGAIIGVVGVLLGVFITHKFQERRDAILKRGILTLIVAEMIFIFQRVAAIYTEKHFTKTIPLQMVDSYMLSQFFSIAKNSKPLQAIIYLKNQYSHFMRQLDESSKCASEADTLFLNEEQKKELFQNNVIQGKQFEYMPEDCKKWIRLMKRAVSYQGTALAFLMEDGKVSENSQFVGTFKDIVDATEEILKESEKDKENLVVRDLRRQFEKDKEKLLNSSSSHLESKQPK